MKRLDLPNVGCSSPPKVKSEIWVLSTTDLAGGEAADRTFWGQFLGGGRGGAVCLAMKVLFWKLEKLSGQLGDNARERLDLPGIGAY